MTIMELINNCIAELGNIHCSINDQESIGLPVYRVKRDLVALKEALENQAKQNKAEQDEGEI